MHEKSRKQNTVASRVQQLRPLSHNYNCVLADKYACQETSVEGLLVVDLEVASFGRQSHRFKYSDVLGFVNSIIDVLFERVLVC